MQREVHNHSNIFLQSIFIMYYNNNGTSKISLIKSKDLVAPNNSYGVVTFYPRTASMNPQTPGWTPWHQIMVYFMIIYVALRS